MPACPICNRVFVKKHTCPGGKCEECKKNVVDLKRHKCPIAQLNLVPELANSQAHMHKCDGCNRSFCQRKFRVFQSVELCSDCYDIPEIRQDQELRRSLVHQWICDTQQTNCAMCHELVFDAQSMKKIRKFEMDHINPFTKIHSVGTMIFEGFPIAELLNEIPKCRILCIPCHSAVTYLQVNCGILRLDESYWTDELQMQIDKSAKQLRNITL